MASGIISRFDQLSASQRARLTPTGELRAGVGTRTRVVERTSLSAPPSVVTEPKPVGNLAGYAVVINRNGVSNSAPFNAFRA